MKRYFFLAGLPRSGSTLLTCLLNQNPEIYCSNESPMCDLLYRTERYFAESIGFNSSQNKEGHINVCNSLVSNYYSCKSQPYIIDKFRSWGTPDNLNLIRKYITDDVKIICPVRSINEILASFINLFHRHSDRQNFVDHNIINNGRFIYRSIDDVRCDELMIPNGPIDSALFAMSQYNIPENRGVFHFVEYDDLITSPKETMDGIYNFLEINTYQHNFDNIQQSTEINHNYHNLPTMHVVRNTLEKKSTPPEDILSPYIINKYKDYEFWR